MDAKLTHIRDRLLAFQIENETMPDVEERMSAMLFGEVMNDFQDKKIKNFHDWLKYYSTEGNDFEDIVSITESYYFKVLRNDLGSIDFNEKVMVYNAIALYSTEMDVDKPTGQLFNKIVLTFVEIVRHYNLFLKGYLSLKGEISISNRSKTKFYSVWSNGSTFTKEMPITLFSANE